MKLIVTPQGMQVEYENIPLGPPHGTNPTLHPDPTADPFALLFCNPTETIDIADSPTHDHHPNPTTEQRLEQVNQLFLELDPTLPDMYEEWESRNNPIPQHLLATDEELDKPPGNTPIPQHLLATEEELGNPTGKNTPEVQAEIDAAKALIPPQPLPTPLPPPPNDQYLPEPTTPERNWSIFAAANSYYNTPRDPSTRNKL